MRKILKYAGIILLSLIFTFILFEIMSWYHFGDIPTTIVLIRLVICFCFLCLMPGLIVYYVYKKSIRSVVENVVKEHLINRAKRELDGNIKNNYIYAEAHKILKIDKKNKSIYLYAMIANYHNKTIHNWLVGPCVLHYNYDNKMYTIDSIDVPDNKESNLYLSYKIILPDDLIEICFKEDCNSEFYQSQLKKYINIL